MIGRVHACDALRVIAEAEAAGMLRGPARRRAEPHTRRCYGANRLPWRCDCQAGEQSILDRFLGPTGPPRARDPMSGDEEEHMLSREELVEREHQARLRENEEWQSGLRSFAGRRKSVGGRLTLGYHPPRRTGRMPRPDGA